MVTMPLTQRIYDKTKADRSAFGHDLGEWIVTQSSNGFKFDGTANDIYWQKSKTHLQRKIAEYFEWVEEEASKIYPSSHRRTSIEQCIGAIQSYSREIRDLTVEKHRSINGLNKGFDPGQWDGTDDAFIASRGMRLIEALGLDKKASFSFKLNNIVTDHKWLPILVSTLSLIIAITAFFK